VAENVAHDGADDVDERISTAKELPKDFLGILENESKEIVVVIVIVIKMVGMIAGARAVALAPAGTGCTAGARKSGTGRPAS